MVVLYTYMHGNNTKYICVRVCVSRGSGMYDLDGSPPPGDVPFLELANGTPTLSQG